MLRRRPELRLELAVEKYRRGTVSLNRAAERAGVSTEKLKTELAEHGIPREADFLEAAEREGKLDDERLYV